MRHFLISIAKAFEFVTYALFLLLSVCYAILAIACATTYLYRTSHRLWGYLFLLFLFYGCIGYLILNIAKHILMIFIPVHDRSSILPPSNAEKRKNRVENKILDVCTVAIYIVGIIMVPYSQTFTGDPWWATVHTISMFQIAVPFFFGNFFQTLLYNSILKWSKSIVLSRKCGQPCITLTYPPGRGTIRAHHHGRSHPHAVCRK